MIICSSGEPKLCSKKELNMVEADLMSTHKQTSHSARQAGQWSVDTATTQHYIKVEWPKKYSVSYTSKPDSSIREKTSEYSNVPFQKHTNEYSDDLRKKNNVNKNRKLWYQYCFSGSENLPSQWNAE